jgi:ABC-type branched-subunit amino acid transport system ATPase component/branched-subunit amino acid ABC-type transport system permease component
MILPFIVIGLVSGSIYGLAGVGLVLTYKTSNVFNFAQGGLAAIAAYVFYGLYVQNSVPWPLAALITVLVVAPPLAYGFSQLGKVLSGKSLALRVASTVGILLVIEAAIVLIYGVEVVRTVPVFLGQGTFEVLGTSVQVASLVTFLVALCATAGLYAYFRLTRGGKAMRAVVDGAELLELAGTSSARIRFFAWLIGMVFVCVSGVLLAPVLPLDPTQLTLLVVSAYGAAAVGAFTSLPLTFAGGLGIGIAASLATKYFTTGILAGIAPAFPFIVLFAVLLVFPRRFLAERSLAIPLSRPTWVTPLPVQIGGGAVLVAFLAVVPGFAGVHLTDWTIALANIIMFLSLGLLVRTAGQVSLCQITFMAIGATVFSHLTSGAGLPWLPALILAGLVAVPVGAVLAIPAIRLTPLYLALATFGFGVFVQYAFYQQGFMFGPGGAALTVPRPSWLGLGSDRGYYYLVLVFAILASGAMVWLNRSRLGRLLRGMADSPTAVATGGTSTVVTWTLVFCLSAAIAAVAGALSAAASQTISITSYPPLESLTFLALVIIVVGGAPWYAVLAGIGLTVPPSYISGFQTSYWLQLIFGVSAVLYAVTPEHLRGAPPAVQRALDSIFRRRRDRIPAAAEPAPVTVSSGTVEPGVLQVRDLTMRFGGLVAVDGLTVTAPTGRITALIGPNGAGKTTTFNACSGLVSPTSGRVTLDERDLTSTGPASRAQRGIGRTFQQMQLFDSLTVRENVALGAEALLAGSNPIRHVFGRRGDSRQMGVATDRALNACDIGELSDRLVGTLSTGQRRLVELARCLAGSFRILLLDEPSSGLDKTETARFAQILQRVVAEREVGILIVEHDMSLVMEVCEYIYVLDFGHMVFEGTPEQVVNSPIVQAAYLGDEAVEAAALADPQIVGSGNEVTL